MTRPDAALAPAGVHPTMTCPDPTAPSPSLASHLTRRMDAMFDWLEEVALRHDGAIPSWENPGHPGYPYPEAAGLWLSAVADARPSSRAIAPTVAWLQRQVDERGLVGRHGRAYIFDSAMVLSGLLAARAAGSAVHEGLIERMLAAVVAAVEVRWATEGALAGSRRWSDRWACHQLKLAWALRRGIEEGACSIPVRDAARRALGDLEALRGLERGGRFALAEDDDRSYVHASCYALEGVLALRGQPGLAAASRDDLTAQLHRGARWLEASQEADGALPCWLGPGLFLSVPDEGIRRPSDVIAQAVRLWAFVDAGRYAGAIERGIDALVRRQQPGGSLVYLEESHDLNSWCTVFAAQALRTTLAAQPGSSFALPRWLA